MDSDTSHKTIRALIVDDEELARDLIVHMLGNHPEVEIVSQCQNGIEATQRLAETDLVFLDIKMPGMDGIVFADSIDSENPPIIVFITAYDEFAIQAFEKNALDYLLKPFDQKRFDQMIERVKGQIDANENIAFANRLKSFLSNKSPISVNPHAKYVDRIVVKDRGRVYFVKVDEIEYVEASGNYVALHVGGKTHLVYDTLSKIESTLDPNRFLRIHRSTIVSIDQIKELQPHFNAEFVVLLKSGHTLKLSRSYSESAKKRLGLSPS